jgi:hypothetical protein
MPVKKIEKNQKPLFFPNHTYKNMVREKKIIQIKRSNRHQL